MTGQDGTAWYPSFSADGLKIFYRSERDGGGLYVRDALAGPGGAEMKLVDGGDMPAVSPDGTTVAYLVTSALTGRAALFVVPAGGGAPRQIAQDLVAVWPASAGGHQPPLWSPDSRSILLRGMRGSDRKTLGLWVASVADSKAEAIEGLPACPDWFARYAVAWRGEFLYYVEGEPINGSTLYRVHLTPGPWRATGAPEKLASFAGVALSASVSARGRMVLPILTFEPNLWSAGLQPGKGTSEGPLEAVTVDSNGKRRLSVAANGSRLAYSTYGPPGQGNVEVRLRDLATGRESLVAGSGTYPFLDPVLSPDGSKVAFVDRREDKLVAYVAESGSTAGQVVCENCRVLGFFPGSSEVLVQVGDQLSRRRLDGNGETPLLRNPHLDRTALSPDGTRLAFTQARPDGSAALYEVDLTRPSDRPDSWVLVAEDRRHVGSPTWSPDGRLLYYVSQHDGSPCVWVQPLDADGRLAGPASAALHLHSGNGVVGRMTSIGVTNDRLFLLLTRTKGDIWSIELER
jgi:Tol biopolymer transport system component